MTNDHIRHGRGAVRPYVYANADAIVFVQTVFGAEVLERHDTPLGAHVEAAIGDAVIVLEAADTFPAHVVPTTASIYVYVEDVDAAYNRALEAGATSVSPPEDKPYEERQCGVKDSFGNTWWVSTYVGSDKLVSV